jgi:hypothetical protein
MGQLIRATRGQTCHGLGAVTHALSLTGRLRARYPHKLYHVSSSPSTVIVRASSSPPEDEKPSAADRQKSTGEQIRRWFAGSFTASDSNGISSLDPKMNETVRDKRRERALDEWSSTGPEDDWDEWSGTPIVTDLDDSEEVAELREAVIRRRRSRMGERSTVRDEYLRPIVDPTGIYNRVALGEKEAEERVFVEAITNQYESREALRYAGVLIGIPLVAGFAVSRIVAQPLWDFAQELDVNAFALSDEQKVEGAEAMHREEVKIRLAASLGQAPDVTDEDLLQHLHEEALVFSQHKREENKRALLNVVSDSTSAAIFFILLVRDNSPRAILFRTIGRVFTGLSDTAKAFIIILVTDTLLGYHSEEGWTAALSLLSHHYGLHAQTDGLHLFVATVPVLLDSLFKYWIFVELNKIDPAAAVTLRQMDRH